MKRKRVQKRNKINKVQTLKIYGINAAGIKCKLKSFSNVLSRLSPQIWMIEETKLKPGETIKCENIDDFQVFYLYRHNSQGGGLALGVTRDLESTLIRDGDDDVEAMAVQVVVGTLPIRVLLAYGAQENDMKEKKDNFWNFLEEEVNLADVNEEGLILQMDGNLHAGPDLVQDDPNPQNKNGKMFLEFLERNPSLIVVNTLDICEGLITRRREVKQSEGIKTEKAVLDFFVVNERMLPFITKLFIDEDREYSLSNFAQLKANRRVIESDHNPLVLDLSIEFSKKKPQRVEMFNLKNKACQEAFKRETENNNELIDVFNSELPFESQSRNWFKIFNSILYKCFRKVRITNSKKKTNTRTDDLLFARIKLQKQAKEVLTNEEMKGKIEERIRQIEKDIEKEVSEEYIKEVVDSLKALGGEKHSLGGKGRKQMWNLLKNKCPKRSSSVPVGKKDKRGNLITNHEGLKQLYLQTYTHRLRNRPIKSEFEEIKDLKDELFDMRLKISEGRKTKLWVMKDLEKVLKGLKREKARDPHGWSNVIFKEDVAGKNLKLSMLRLFNKIKTEGYFPEFMRKTDVTTIYKGKGEKSNLDNDRGIFLVTIFRAILMKLIYLGKYEHIDDSTL